MMKLKDVLWVFFISMVPIIELRGAVPVGSVLGLPFYINFAVATIGNLLPVPFILLLIPHVLNFMEKFKVFRPIVRWVRKKAMKNSKKLSVESTEVTASESADEADTNSNPTTSAESRAMTHGMFLGLLLFVLLPLPGTGAWTGALVASLFGFPKFKSFIAIMLGVLGCGVIMCLAS